MNSIGLPESLLLGDIHSLGRQVSDYRTWICSVILLKIRFSNRRPQPLWMQSMEITKRVSKQGWLKGDIIIRIWAAFFIIGLVLSCPRILIWWPRKMSRISILATLSSARMFGMETLWGRLSQETMKAVCLRAQSRTRTRSCYQGPPRQVSYIDIFTWLEKLRKPFQAKL